MWNTNKITVSENMLSVKETIGSNLPLAEHLESDDSDVVAN